jgi:hypothetical protein
MTMMAMATLAAVERPSWEASRLEELSFAELFCDAEAEDVLAWELLAVRVEVSNVLPGELNCVRELGEDVREIIVMDTWVVMGEEGALSAVVSDVTRVAESCISAERVSNTAAIRKRGAGIHTTTSAALL